jgi:DNA-dependent RNA polymerase auxiliary subunit epsilon
MTSDELRALLEMTTNYSFEYLQSLSKEQLEKIYEAKTNDQIQR